MDKENEAEEKNKVRFTDRTHEFSRLSLSIPKAGGTFHTGKDTESGDRYIDGKYLGEIEAKYGREAQEKRAKHGWEQNRRQVAERKFMSDWEHQRVVLPRHHNFMSVEVARHRNARLRDAVQALESTDDMMASLSKEQMITSLDVADEVKTRKRRKLRDICKASIKANEAISSSLLSNVELWDEIDEARKAEKKRLEKEISSWRAEEACVSASLPAEGNAFPDNFQLPCARTLSASSLDLQPTMKLRQIYMEDGKRKVPRLRKTKRSPRPSNPLQGSDSSLEPANLP